MVTISRETLDKYEFGRLTASQGLDSPPIIVIRYECENGYSSVQSFSDKSKFNDLQHLGFHIRKNIKTLVEKGFNNSKATCSTNPWGIKIEIDQFDFYEKT